MSADPVSWLVIERGWKVIGRGGDELGSVEEVLGDTDKDIFNGLTVARGFFSSARYVPAERVAAIEAGQVVVDVGRDELPTDGNSNIRTHRAVRSARGVV